MEARQLALHVLDLPTLFQVHRVHVQAKSARSLSNGGGRIQLMTPIFKSQQRLHKWLIREIFLSESFRAP